MKTAIVWAGVIIIIVMCLFPPCTRGQGYHWLLDIPRGMTIDTTRLILQCVIVGLLTGCIFWTVGRTNWERGFKRIIFAVISATRARLVDLQEVGPKKLTLLLAIAAATVSGICTGAIPIRKYCDAQGQWFLKDPLVVREPGEQEAKEFEKWVQEMAAKGIIIDESYYFIEKPPKPAPQPDIFDKVATAEKDPRLVDLGPAPQPTSRSLPFHLTSIPTLNEIRPDLLKTYNVRWWQNLSKPKLVGLCILAGLAGASSAFAGVWVVFWFGGRSVYRIIRWVVLGFRDEKPNS